MKTFSTYQTDIPRIINNVLPDDITWCTEMLNDSIRYLVTRYYFNERTYVVPGGTVAQQQFYNLPPQVKKLINVTELIGNVLWQPKECSSRSYWDTLNTVVYYQDYPSYFFVWNSQVGIFPNPASSGNVLTLNYKTRIVDLTQADVTDVTSAKTMAATNGSATITASGNVFLNWMAGQWIRIPFSSTNSTDGDNNWYQILSITNATTAILYNQYTGASVSGAAFTIGQVPILPEDYQDLPLYRMAILYYTVRFPDPVRAQLFQKQWDDGFEALNAEFGSKSTDVRVTDIDNLPKNPNLYQANISGPY